MSNSSDVAVRPRALGRRELLFGLALAAGGVIGYAVQVRLGRLFTPWYLPCLAAAGAALIGVSLWRRRNVWRYLAMAVVLLLAAAEVAFLASVRLSAYAGPIAEGRPMPEFETLRADETLFTNRDLAGQNHVFVFFRGRW